MENPEVSDMVLFRLPTRRAADPPRMRAAVVTKTYGVPGNQPLVVDVTVFLQEEDTDIGPGPVRRFTRSPWGDAGYHWAWPAPKKK